MSDNPILETAEKFYGKAEVDEPTKPTETEAVTKQVQVPEQEVNKLEKPADKVEESANTETESQYLDLDGKETSLEDVRKWRDGHMMQSDYTKKTTSLSDDRKTFETERDTSRDELLKSQTEVSELRDTLQALVQEDESVDWAELKADDPDRYIELKELADKRKTAIDKIKAERNTPVDDPALIVDEQRKLIEANPEWLDDDKKTTEAYTKDTALIQAYALKNGFSEEFKNMTRSHHMITLLKAAKYDKLQEKGRKIKEQRDKVPVVLKPKGKTNSEPETTRAERFYGKTG